MMIANEFCNPKEKLKKIEINYIINYHKKVNKKNKTIKSCVTFVKQNNLRRTKNRQEI